MKIVSNLKRIIVEACEKLGLKIDKNEVKIFVREITRPKKYMHRASFSYDDSELKINVDDEFSNTVAIEDAPIDLDVEKTLLTPDEINQKEGIVSRGEDDKEEEDEEDKDEDKETYPEYEE